MESETRSLGDGKHGTNHKKKMCSSPDRIFNAPGVAQDLYVIQKKAKSLGLEIDFKRNFEQWFERQLEQLGQELDGIAMDQSNKKKILAVHTSSVNISS
ncbi:MAG: hypothetical protein DSY57_00790, partial [Desulfobulbus sp.]